VLSALMILWRFSEKVRLRRVLGLLYRIDVSGVEHVPSSGPCIIVANHESVTDPWIVCLATPRRVRFMAKAELWKYPVIRWVMESYGTFPVERGSGDTGAMERAGELLEAGELLGMFPRGTSRPTGNRRWHRGAARLALAYGAPIVPVRIENTRQVLPRRRMRVVVGAPIHVERTRPTIAAARQLTRAAEAAVEALA
jgi:1-acyl-sn-glycerol-3-phosphate acyltransferase